MAKSKGRLLAELLASDGKVKESKSALDISGGKLAPGDIPILPNSKLENSSISIAGHSTSLGGSVSLNTGDITEHTNYKYYTEGRARGAISAASGGGHGSVSYNASTGALSVTGVSTEAIQDVVGAMFGGNTESGITVTYDDTDGTIDLSVTALNTGNVSEGSNLYHTTARARAAISATGSLSYNSTTGVISFTMPAQNTSNITEGSNLYYTNARADARIAAADTGDLSEGSNLYHTTARARAAISASGNAISYNSSTGVISSTFEESPSFTTVTSSGKIKTTGGVLEFTSANHQFGAGSNANNISARVGGAGAAGLHMEDSGSNFRFQIYGDGTNYGFLNSEWGSWNLKKVTSGALYFNNDNTYYIQPESTSNLNVVQAQSYKIGTTTVIDSSRNFIANTRLTFDYNDHYS